MDYFNPELIPDPPSQPEKRKVWLRLSFDALETIILALLLFLGINTISARIRVDSISMQPTLFAGDFVLVNKVAYLMGAPKRGDVVVFKYPPNPEEIPYIKRIIGLPGDHIQIADGQVYVNTHIVLEPYLKMPTSRGGDWIVPPNSYFVMGDNRNNSSDSRSWGFVPIENIIGKAEFIYLPVDRWALLGIPSAVAAESLPTYLPRPTATALPASTPGAYPQPEILLPTVILPTPYP